MKQRLSAEERKRQLLSLMQHVFAEATTQRDFSAARMARQAGISGVLFYRLVGPEYHTFKYRLPGPQQAPDTELGTLRKEVVRLQEALQEAQAQLRYQSDNDYHEAMRIIEQLERENLALRGDVHLLQQRLLEGGYMNVVPTRRSKEGESTEKGS